MQDLMNALPSGNAPLQGVCIIADPLNCPPGYTMIDKTHDRREDADLWKDGLFGRRVQRYICIQRLIGPCAGIQDLVVDITIINDRDPVPAGYTCLEYTMDTKEKAIKKKQLCIRMMSSALTQDAVCDIILLSRQRRPPNEYVLVGDLNHVNLCFRTAKVPSTMTQPLNMASTQLPYTMPPSAQLPYALHSVTPAVQNAVNFNDTSISNDVGSTLGRAPTITPISGILWQINPKLCDNMDDGNVFMPEIRIKTLQEIENEYAYLFDSENSAAAQSLPQNS